MTPANLQLRLDSLIQFSQAIGQNFSEKVLFDLYGFILQDVLHLRRYFLAYDDGIHWRHFCKQLPFDADALVKQLSTISHQDLLSVSPVADFKQMLTITQKDKILARLLFTTEEQETNFDYLEAITSLLVVALFSRNLLQKQIEQESINKELMLAAEIQDMMIPVRLPKDEKLQASVIHLPKSSVSGDYHDIFPLPDGEWLICIGDVSGKGVPAALLRANFQAQLQTLVGVEQSLPELVRELNRRFYRATGGERFITFFIGRLNPELGVLTYVNAGNVDPLAFQNGEWTHLHGGTTLLGAFEELPFVNENTWFFSGKYRIVLCTDGLSEATDIEGKFIHYEQFVASIDSECQLADPAIFNERVMAGIKKFRLSSALEDDFTLLTIQGIA